jgi:hypothetical protein
MARGTWGGALDPNIFKVNLLFLLGTSKCQTGFKLRDYGVQDNDPQEVADTVRTTIGDTFRGVLAQTDSFLGVDVLKLGTDEGAWSPQTTQTGGEAVDAASEEPNFVCCNIALKSEVRKRYGQGRMFIPIVNEAFVSGNVLSATGVSAMQGLVTAIQNNFTGSGATHDLLLVNAHDILPAIGAVGTPGYRAEIPRSWYDVVSIRINSIVTALHSRKAGVGS